MLTVLCRAPVPQRGGVAPALPIARATPRAAHLPQRGGVQDPTGWEVAHPLEIPAKEGRCQHPVF